MATQYIYRDTVYYLLLQIDSQIYMKRQTFRYIKIDRQLDG